MSEHQVQIVVSPDLEKVKATAIALAGAFRHWIASLDIREVVENTLQDLPSEFFQREQPDQARLKATLVEVAGLLRSRIAAIDVREAVDSAFRHMPSEVFEGLKPAPKQAA